jgi:hypothetical protein
VSADLFRATVFTMDTESRTALLRSMSNSLTAKFGDDLFTRLGPTLEPWSGTVDMEVFAPNTHSAPALLEAGEHELFLTFGDAIDCVLFERRPVDEGAFEWALDRIVSAGEHGIEMWHDRRRQLFGGLHQARIVGEPFVDVNEKRLARLTLSATTEPWTTPGRTLLADPLAPAARNGTAFLVDTNIPKHLQEIATSARLQFGSAISIVTRMYELGGRRMLEILPVDREATRMRIKQLTSGAIDVSTGDTQYFEYEFTPVPIEDAVEWVLKVGQLGLLETTVWRGPIYWFVNGPATPEAVEGAESNPRASVQKIWKPWASAID